MKLKHIFFKYPTWILKQMRVFGALSIRLTRLTGKSPYAIHPKHLLAIGDPWYFPYLAKTDTVLDIGCGNGQHTLKTARKVKKIIGIDIRSELIGLAKKVAADTGTTNAEFLVLNAERVLPFQSKSIDKVLFLDVLEHMNKRDKVMHEILRILKKRGRLLLAIPNRETSWKKWQRSVGLDSVTDPDHKIEYSREEIIKYVNSFAFTLVKILPITYDTPLAPFIDLVGGFSLGMYRRLQLWKKSQVAKYPAETIGFRLVLQKI